MLFQRKKVRITTQIKEEKREQRRRYCRYYYNMKRAMRAYDTIKSAYDPYQIKERADESGFDPYVNDQTTMMNIDSEGDVFYDAPETFDECLPAAKRIRTMASSVIDTAAHTLVWGAMAAVHYVYTEKKNLEDYFASNSISSVKNSNRVSDMKNMLYYNTTGTASTYPYLNSQQSKTPAMRGFGVDFAPLVERNPAMNTSMKKAERNLRVLCLESNHRTQEEAYCKKLISCGVDHQKSSSLKRSIDDTWGFVEKNNTVKFKATIPPLKPPRKVYVQPTYSQR